MCAFKFVCVSELVRVCVSFEGNYARILDERA